MHRHKSNRAKAKIHTEIWRMERNSAGEREDGGGTPQTLTSLGYLGWRLKLTF